jgi:hypothetical protein
MTFRGVLFVFALCVSPPCSGGEAPQQLAAGEAAALGALKSLPREWSHSSRRDCRTYEDKNLDRLSPAFAESAAAFLKAFVETHGRVTITSAHRTAEEQTCVCDGERGPCAGRPRIVKGKKGRRYVKRTTSRHQSGDALDVRAGTGALSNGPTRSAPHGTNEEKTDCISLGFAWFLSTQNQALHKDADDANRPARRLVSPIARLRKASAVSPIARLLRRSNKRVRIEEQHLCPGNRKLASIQEGAKKRPNFSTKNPTFNEGGEEVGKRTQQWTITPNDGLPIAIAVICERGYRILLWSPARKDGS